MKKVVLAFDKFKGVATSKEVAEAARVALLASFADVEVVVLPCADGGEGTMEALAPAGAKRVEVDVCGPLPDMHIKASYCLHGVTAVMEMASASGLALLKPEQRDVMNATSLGTGMLIRHAITQGAREVVLGIGGSASNDGGMGILQALGVRFFDSEGNQLPPCGESLANVAAVDSSHVMPEALRTRFHIITDVDNPLFGPRGAAAVYGPQKGATPAQVAMLDEGLRHFASFMPPGVAHSPGAGAAGGVGAGLKAFLQAELHPGADAVLHFLYAQTHITDADLVLTGEGKIDASTSCGKLPHAVAKLAASNGMPAVALCGMVEGTPPQEFAEVHCINPVPADLPQALEKSVCLQRVAQTVNQIASKYLTLSTL
ncbi:MAG: glycerate kinase [Sodaliphilus sp.]